MTMGEQSPYLYVYLHWVTNYSSTENPAFKLIFTFIPHLD